MLSTYIYKIVMGKLLGNTMKSLVSLHQDIPSVCLQYIKTRVVSVESGEKKN